MAKWSKRSCTGVFGESSSGIVVALAKSRGFDVNDQSFFSPSLSTLSPTSSLGDGAIRAAAMIVGCKGKHAAVIGDYDADGVVSSAIMKRTIELAGGKCSVFLPSRWKHGYGLNDKTVGAFIARFGGSMPEKLFVVDCGSSSEQHVLALKAAGVKEVAIIDHHIISKTTESKSADAHVNWRLCGTSKNLCASGEVMQVAREALTTIGIGWEWMLPLAAIATVGDAVEISGDNRTIVRIGADYSRMSAGDFDFPGLVSLAMKRCRGGVSQKNLAFYVVPRINAVGRLGDPDGALDFLLERDPVTATRLMIAVEETNDQRKAIQDSIFRKGISMIGGPEANPNCVFLHEPDWNIGVCGISCSQMVEKYRVPAMMFGTHDGKVRGSGRSIPGVNLKAVLDACGEEVFERYGGHEMACGAVVRGGMFAEARRRFSSELEKLSFGKPVSCGPQYDVDLSPDQATYELGNALFESLYPYCPTSNPEPVFRIPSATVKSVSINQYKVYAKMEVVVEKDGKSSPVTMSTFLRMGIDDAKLSLSKGDVADFYFSFPQTTHFDCGFGEDEYALELVDVELSGQ